MEKQARDKYTLIIGLEVHAQLLTKSKIYNSDSAQFGDAPNTNLSVITLAHPGTLPKLNKRVIEYAVKMGLACNSVISRQQIFDRKNYFYPDLPKGYQLTQDRTPICVGGHITINVKSVEKDINLNRIHIEEDAGKSIHLANENDTLVDFNRSGVPLIEIVTNPEIKNSDEAYALLTEIRKLVRYLGICDGNMEEGSLRCDANVSVMLNDAKELGKKVEVKNMNSIRNVQRAIDHETERQIALLEKGEPVISETRTFDANTGETHSMRTKEELNDYRYFPDPDLSPLQISDNWLDEIRSSMGPLPRELYKDFIDNYWLSPYDAQVLTDNKSVALYFKEVCNVPSNSRDASDLKGIVNWIIGPVKSYLNENGIEMSGFPLPATKLAELIAMIDEGKLNFATASQKIFPEFVKNPKRTAMEIAHEMNLIQTSNPDTILPIVLEVIKEFPLKVESYKNGKKGIIGMFMGEIMKRSNNQADPQVAMKLLEKKLSEL